MNSLEALNTSNQRIRDTYLGKYENELPATGTFFWVDVRDVAQAHVKAMELNEAGGQRFFITAGHFTNKQLAAAVAKNFPDQKGVPTDKTPGGEWPEEGYANFDNSRSKKVLGLEYIEFEKTIVDTVKSLQAVGA